MNRNDDRSVDIVVEHSRQARVIDKKDIEALEAKLRAAHPVSISSDEAQLLQSILHEYAQRTSSTPSPQKLQPSRLTNFATVVTAGVSTGLLCMLLFPTQPIVPIVVAIVATIAAKIALPWMNSL
ncbi:hypothetical protein [Rugamonas rubra]|uniref:Uncharacterized protein n=1 Tax=Rugamonas rubra TaxID=758825 RepID=A0A1I4P5V2_9BURK|nr:hypothetical protein [Rugamonas rubra]SFM22996.1 hypothetical protein SAMN02982985_03277 [Rugamonas rubra]